MSETPNDNRPEQPKSENTTWGSKLFIAVFLALLAFFYWLLIYSGGVTVHHG